MTCDYLDGGVCKVASAMVNADVRTYPDTCNACQKQAEPKTINIVTCGLANLYVLENKKNKADYPSVVACFSQQTHLGEGPGTELKKILSWFVKPIPTCPCHARMRTMNEWGPDGCQARIETILDWLKDSAEKQRLPFIRPIVAIIVQKAISNARTKSAKTV